MRRRLFSAVPRGPAPAAATSAPTTSVAALGRKYAQRQPLVFLTAYDAPTAARAEAAGADALLVGDSFGMCVLGFRSTVPVTLAHMELACAAAARGARSALLVADLPFGTYTTASRASAAATRLVQRGGAHAVKLEGGRAQAPRLAAVVREGIPAMGHVGLLPQTAPLAAGGSYALQGRSAAAALRCVEDALAVQEAGAFAVVLEMVPAQVAAFVSALLRVPTIGIGAGPFCGGQVLVAHDLLGLVPPLPPPPSVTPPQPRFLRRYADLGGDMQAAFARYADDVRRGRFPGGVGVGAGGARLDFSKWSAALPVDFDASPDSALPQPQPSPPPPQPRQHFFDMARHELDSFRELVQRHFGADARALSALESAALELESRSPASSTPAAFGAAMATLSSVRTNTPVTSRVPLPAQPPPRKLNIAILGSGAVASLLAVALGSAPQRVARLAMLSSWSSRVALLQRRGGVPWRRNIQGRGHIDDDWDGASDCDGDGDGEPGPMRLGARGLEAYDLTPDATGQGHGQGAQLRLLRVAAGAIEAAGTSNNPAALAAALAAVTADIESAASLPSSPSSLLPPLPLLGAFDVVLLCGKAHQAEAQAALAALLLRPRVRSYHKGVPSSTFGVCLPLYNGDFSFEAARHVFARATACVPALDAFSKSSHASLPTGPAAGAKAASTSASSPLLLQLMNQLAAVGPVQVAYGQTSLGARFAAPVSSSAPSRGVDGERDEREDCEESDEGLVEHTGHGLTRFCVPPLGQGADVKPEGARADEEARDRAGALATLAAALGVPGASHSAGDGPGPGDGSGGWLLQPLAEAAASQAAFEHLRWRKLAVNAVLNPLASLLGLPNGDLAAAATRPGAPFEATALALAEEALRAGYRRKVAGAVTYSMRQSAIVRATAHDHFESPRALLRRVELVAAATASNTSSTLADLRRGRPSEAPLVMGAVVAVLGRRARATSAAMKALAARDAALGIAVAPGAARVVAAAMAWRAEARRAQAWLLES